MALLYGEGCSGFSKLALKAGISDTELSPHRLLQLNMLFGSRIAYMRRREEGHPWSVARDTTAPVATGPNFPK